MVLDVSALPFQKLIELFCSLNKLFYWFQVLSNTTVIVSSCVTLSPSIILLFFGDSRPWVASRYCRDRSVVRWSWSSWNVSHSGTNEWKDETSQMPGGHSSQQWYEDGRSTFKDRFERTRHKMCRHQLNEWAWKNDEKLRWKYQPDCEDSCTWVISICFSYDQRAFASQVEKWEKTPMLLICSFV